MYLFDPDEGRRRRAMLRENGRRARLRYSERFKTLGRELRGELSSWKGALPGR